MKRMLWMAVALGASVGYADQLVIMGQQTREGTFQGFENGKIEFQDAGGRFVKEQSSRVSKLVLAAPLKAAYQTVTGKRVEDVTLKGFEKGKFMFVGKDGKDTPVVALQIKAIEPVFAGAGGGGGGDAGDRYPIPPVDLSRIAGDLSPAQQKALDGFKAAKKAFDEYVAESSAIVQEMDKLKGPKREELLNQLRRRKEQEQPLRGNLISAYKTFRDAFADAQAVEEPAAEQQPANPPANVPAKPTTKPATKPTTKSLPGLKTLK